MSPVDHCRVGKDGNEGEEQQPRQRAHRQDEDEAPSSAVAATVVAAAFWFARVASLVPRLHCQSSDNLTTEREVFFHSNLLLFCFVLFPRRRSWFRWCGNH